VHTWYAYRDAAEAAAGLPSSQLKAENPQLKKSTCINTNANQNTNLPVPRMLPQALESWLNPCLGPSFLSSNVLIIFHREQVSPG